MSKPVKAYALFGLSADGEEVIVPQKIGTWSFDADGEKVVNHEICTWRFDRKKLATDDLELKRFVNTMAEVGAALGRKKLSAMSDGGKLLKTEEDIEHLKEEWHHHKDKHRSHEAVCKAIKESLHNKYGFSGSTKTIKRRIDEFKLREVK